MVADLTRERLILEHYKLVLQIAQKLSGRYPASVELDDLISIGTLGLIDAADRFNATLSVSFGSYARIRIQGAIVDALRRQDWVPRIVRARAKTLKQVKQELRQNLGRLPSNTELANFCKKLGIDNFYAFQTEAHATRLVSTEEHRAESETRIGDFLKSPSPRQDDQYETHWLNAQIQHVLAALDERERNILRFYYFDDLSMRAIGERLNITESRVCQLHKRIREKVKAHCIAREIHQAA